MNYDFKKYEKVFVLLGEYMNCTDTVSEYITLLSRSIKKDYFQGKIKEDSFKNQMEILSGINAYLKGIQQKSAVNMTKGCLVNEKG